MGRCLSWRAWRPAPSACAPPERARPDRSVVEQGQTQGRPAAGDPPALIAEGIVGGVLSVLHARLASSPTTVRGTRDQETPTPRSLLELTGPLMGMIVLPYLGPTAARKEIERAHPQAGRHEAGRSQRSPAGSPDALHLPHHASPDVESTDASGTRPTATIGESAGIGDQGQASKLLARLHRLGSSRTRAESQPAASPTPGCSPQPAPGTRVDCRGKRASRHGRHARGASPFFVAVRR